jgi:hypothetical protein
MEASEVMASDAVAIRGSTTVARAEPTSMSISKNILKLLPTNLRLL